MDIHILIPTCDRPQYLASSLLSIIPQYFACLDKGISIQVSINDTGTTNTFKQEIARKAFDALSHYIPVNYGRSKNLKQGSAIARDELLAKASGSNSKYIFFMDDDVIFSDPQTLVTLYNAHEGSKNISGITVPMRDCDQELEIWPSFLLGLKEEWKQEEKVVRGVTLRRALAESSSFLVKPEVLESVGGFNSKLLGKGTGVDTLACILLDRYKPLYELWGSSHMVHLNPAERRVSQVDLQRDDSFMDTLTSLGLSDYKRDRWGMAPALALLSNKEYSGTKP